MFRVTYFQPDTILEIGTSLGIGNCCFGLEPKSREEHK
jgi:predicted O-methyltransferase YrrM